MQKGQVAIYVLIGVLLLVGIVIALHLFSVKSTATVHPAREELSPECQAEKARMEERANKCLEKKLEEVLADYKEEETLLPDLTTVQEYLATGLEISFPDCFHEWPILDRLTVHWDAKTEAHVILTDNGVSATVTQPVSGTCDDHPYHLDTFTARVASDVKPTFEKLDKVRDELLAGKAEKLFDKECNVDPYGLADEGVYSDILLLDDGSSIVWLYDYNTYLNGGEEKPQPVAINLPPCHPGEDGPRFGP